MSYISKNNRVAVFDSEQELENSLNNGTYSDPWGVACKGGKFVWAAESPAGEFITPEAQAVLDRMSGLTATERQSIINYVNAEVTASNWAQVDEFFAFGLSGVNALTGFIAKTATNNGATHVPTQGFDFDGASNFINTNFNPSIDGSNYQLDRGQAEAYTTTGDDIGATRHLFGAFDNTQRVRLQVGNGKNVSFNANTNVNTAGNDIASDTLAGLHSSANVLNYTENGQILGTGANTPTALPASVVHVGNSPNVASNFWIGNVAQFMIGGVLPDQAAHYTNLLQFLIDLGTFSQPVIDSFPQPLAVGESDRIAAFINAEVLAGNWGKYDSFFDFTLTDPANALWDWKRKLSAANNGAVLGATGATFNGVNAWINPIFNVQSSGVNAVGTNYHYEAFISSVTNDGTVRSVFGNNATSAQFNFTYNQVSARLEAYFFNSTANGGRLLGNGGSWFNNSLVAMSCINTSSILLNGNQWYQLSSTNVGVPFNANLFIGQRGNATQWFQGTLSTFMIGGVLPNGTAHNTNIRTLLGL